MNRFFPLLLLSSLTSLSAQSELGKGMEWYNRRAEGSVGSTAKADPIDRAIEHFEKALSGNDGSEAALMLIKALYFKGEYTTSDEDEKKEIFDRGKRFAERYVARYPDSAPFRYWFLVNLGSWSKAYGIIAAAREGVADLMKEHSEKIIELDPDYENGGGYFMLGAVHYSSPYIPFLLSWPDNDEAIVWLRKAVETGKPRLIQMVYLAQSLHKDGQKEEAITLLKKVVSTDPADENLVEHHDNIREAQELLRDYR
ncbi:MAG: tetratricopeptide repeat protein [Candidatus Neomarinimicrobiota bacterium]|nr:tetratricopeptide repeat protein [Candidatus Neomarinimicrobiota bacterium]